MIPQKIPYQIILASQSPRRSELLKMSGINFRTEVVKDIDESYPDNIPMNDIPLHLAGKKQLAYERFWSIDNNMVITADTIVSLNNRVLNKPKNHSDAVEMLCSLSGNMHQVITGVVLKTNIKEVRFTAITGVWFKSLHMDQINYYVETYQPFDKAGAYGIQEWIGLIGIYRIEASYFNVMGLPTDRLYDELIAF